MLDENGDNMFTNDVYMLTQSAEFSIRPGEEKNVNIILNLAPRNLACLYGKVCSKLQPLQDATVVMTSCDTGEMYKTVTDCYGSYVFISMPQGPYKLMATSEGYYASRWKYINVCKCIQPGYDFYLREKPCDIFGYIYGNVSKKLKKTTLLLFDLNHNTLLYQTIPNTDGQYIFYRLQPKKYLINLLCGNKKIDERDVMVKSGIYTRIDFK